MSKIVFVNRSHPVFHFGEILDTKIVIGVAPRGKLGPASIQGRREGERTWHEVSVSEVYPVEDIHDYENLERVLTYNKAYGRPSIAEVFNKKIYANKN